MDDNQNSQQKLTTPLDNLLNEGKISQLTYQKVVCAKRYIERKYKMIKLKRVENNILQEKLKLSGLPENKKIEILTEIQEQESKNLKQKLEKMSASNYESLAIIGRGAFGEVHVCRNKKLEKLLL
jgi:serine/threonine kinase 38